MRTQICLLWFCVVLFAAADGRRLFYRGRPMRKDGMVGAPRNVHNYTLPPEQWYKQKLDHFNPTDTRTWKQRYFTNATFFKPGGPVFLMIGGEGEANANWMVEGTWIQYAQKYGALCFLLEHRYYGKSQPTDDVSVKNLVYLSSEQALADLAYFTMSMKSWYGLKTNKWIAFGGSYPGGLAAWYRMKYPHLVDGSVASSAPVYAKINFMEYLGVVQNALATSTVGNECNDVIREAVQDIERLLQKQAGWETIYKEFKLCNILDATDKNDVSNLFEVLTDNFNSVVQYNKDNRDFEGANNNITIDTLCGIMGDDSLGTPMNRYAAVNSLILKAAGENCLDFKYKTMIAKLQETSWNKGGAGARQWTYQTCTEFGYYQSSDLKTQPFGHKFPVQFSIQQCADIFGPKYNLNLLQLAVNRTNTFYGGKDLKVSKVVFPNGSIDPWHALGITKNLSADAIAIYINGTAHCANMYPPSPMDLPQLKQAREMVGSLIGTWIA